MWPWARPLDPDGRGERRRIAKVSSFRSRRQRRVALAVLAAGRGVASAANVLARIEFGRLELAVSVRWTALAQRGGAVLRGGEQVDARRDGAVPAVCLVEESLQIVKGVMSVSGTELILASTRPSI